MNTVAIAPESLIITRGSRPGVLGAIAFVTFDAKGGTLQISLYLDRLIRWEFTPGAEGLFEEGGDLGWAWGRIRGLGPAARRFWHLKDAMGLTLGQIEAELRELTGYQEGTE